MIDCITDSTLSIRLRKCDGIRGGHETAIIDTDSKVIHTDERLADIGQIEQSTHRRSCPQRGFVADPVGCKGTRYPPD